MNREVEWNPLAVLDTPNPGQLPTTSRMLRSPLEMTKDCEVSHTPVMVVGANMS